MTINPDHDLDTRRDKHYRITELPAFFDNNGDNDEEPISVTRIPWPEEDENGLPN